MRIVTPVVASCRHALALALAVTACSGDEFPDAWDPGATTTAQTSGDPPLPDPSDASSDSSSTDDADASATTTSGTSAGTSTTDDPPAPADLPPQALPLPQAFELPFTCADAWRLDSWGHAPALDMVREPDQHGTEGAPLLAPAAGVVNLSYFHDNAGNIVQIDHGEGWFTSYLHMESRAVEVGAVLVQGDIIGAVGRTGPTSNDHPHLHFELGIDADGDGEASWGFEGAERVNPWFGGVEYGQRNAVTWRDVVSMNCP